MTKKQLSLFTPAIIPGVVSTKNQMDIMQFPFFSLSKRKRVTPILFGNNKVKIEVHGTEKFGIANIFDADFLIYITSFLKDAQNRGEKISRNVTFSGYQFLEYVGKDTSGRAYANMKSGLDRLQSTTVITSIRHDDFHTRNAFSWISDWQVVERNGRPLGLSFALSDWLYRGITEENLVLTLSKEYFEIASGFERFVYWLCRKVAGKDQFLQMKFETVYHRCGLTISRAKTMKHFERLMEEQPIPDYWIFLAKRAASEEWYICAFPRSKYPTKETAFHSITFTHMDRLAAGLNS